MRVQASLEVLAPPEKVFEALADLTARADFMADIETWEHLSGPVNGEGGRYRLRTRVGPVALASLVEIVDWKPPTVFSWTSLKGLRTWGRFTVRETARGSRVTFRLGYASGENLLGFVVDRVAAPLVRRQVQATLRALGERVVAGMQRRVRRAVKEAAEESRVTKPAREKQAAARRRRTASSEPAAKRSTATGSKKRTAARSRRSAPRARVPSKAARARREKGLPREHREPVKRSATEPA